MPYICQVRRQKYASRGVEAKTAVENKGGHGRPCCAYHYLDLFAGQLIGQFILSMSAVRS